MNEMIEALEILFYSKLFWITFILTCLHVYMKKTIYSYWQRHGIPHDEFTVPFGVFDRKFFMLQSSLGAVIRGSYEKFKKYPFHGIYMFNNRVLMINDRELIKQILVKDFANFRDRGLYCDTEIDPLSGNLAFLNGDRWKTLRAKLTPTFTSGKLKHTYPILTDLANKMLSVVDENLLETNIIEMQDIITRFMLDATFSLAFGYTSEVLKCPDNELFYYGNLSVKNTLLRNTCGFFAPKLMYALRQPFFSPKLTKFFVQLFQDMVEKRRADGIKRNDFLDSIIDCIDHKQIIDNEMQHSSMEMSTAAIAIQSEMLEAIAQAFLFFFGGFSTSTNVVSFCLYELALNPEIQERVQKEIDELQNNPKSLNYENLMQLEYLDMVIHETLRKHPALPFLNRISLSDYKIPNSEYTIPSGMNIIISISGLNMDPDIFPEPQKFDPERFNRENVVSRQPCSYLAFGEGPRACIGKLLGMLQSKISLFHLLTNYTFSICEKTSVPAIYSPISVFQSPRDGMNLKVQKRKKLNN